MTTLTHTERAALTVTNVRVSKIEAGDKVIGRWAVNLHTVEKVERVGRMFRVTLSGGGRPVMVGPNATMKRAA